VVVVVVVVGVHNYAAQRVWKDGKPLGLTDQQAAGITDVVGNNAYYSYYYM